MAANGSARRAGRITVAIAAAVALVTIAVAAAPGGATLPPPSDADPRLLAVDAALGLDLGKARDSDGRRAVSLKKLFKKAGPKALAATRAAFAEGFDRLDAMTVPPARRARGAARAAGCDLPRGAPSQSFSGNGFDAHVDTSTGQATIGVEVGGGKFRIETELNLCDTGDPFKVPDCPTANGVLEAEDHSQHNLAVKVFDGGQLLSSISVRLQSETKIKAQVGDDAKLDYFDITHVYRMNATLGGSNQAYGPVTIKIAYTGSTRVDMPSGQYDASTTEADLRLQMRGVDPADLGAAEAGQKQKLRKSAEAEFATAIDKAIKRLREKETGWNQVNKCASVSFDPPSRTITIAQGDSGQVRPKIDSKQGGSPPTATWTMTDPANATFTPDTAEGNPATFGYIAARTGAPADVEAAFKAVSRAGVAAGTWVQRSDPPPPPGFAGSISGTAVYDGNELGAGNDMQAQWEGTLEVTLSPPQQPGEPPSYRLTGGSVVYTYQGHIGGCTVAGSGTIPLASQPDLNGTAVLIFFTVSPRTYQLTVPMTGFVTFHFPRSMCADSNDNGDDYGWNPGAGIPALEHAPAPGGPVGDDWSIAGSGSGNFGFGTPDQTWVWNLTPTS